MASFFVQQLGPLGVNRAGATVFRAAECLMGGALLRDIWDNPNNPPAGVTIPLPWTIILVDHNAVHSDPGDALGIVDLDDDAIYLVRVLDGDQTIGPPANLIPTLEAWAAGLPRV